MTVAPISGIERPGATKGPLVVPDPIIFALSSTVTDNAMPHC